MLLFFGILRYHNKTSFKTKDQFITLVQPNIKQSDKWNLKKRDQHLKKLVKLSSKHIDEFSDKNRIIIWPETSFEGSIPNEMKLLSSISKQVIKNSKTTLIVGLLRTEKSKLYNSLVFLDSTGQILHQYDKI